MAEKMATLANVYNNTSFPQMAIDKAWRGLLLSQHHDCWIVPYNGGRGNTWADKVKVWTATTNRISDSIISNTFIAGNPSSISDSKTIKVYNTTGSRRNEWVKFSLPDNFKATETAIIDNSNNAVTSQIISAENQVYFKADVPAVGYNTYKLAHKKPSQSKGAAATILANGNVVVETDLYRIMLDKSKGGTIKSLVAKAMNGKEFVDDKNERSFNELRGNFFNGGGFHSTADNAVTIHVIEQGPAVVKIEIKGMLLSNPYTQSLTLKQGERRIDCNLRIDWKENTGIGDSYKQNGGLDAKDNHKPFYDDSKKLLVLFPVNFSAEKIYKDAPFDVTESKLDNTFFSRWDSIKNNIMLSWVDVYDAKNNYGLALLTDHTTTYTHGENFPLGLNVQYSGAGLWGRNHTITGPTEINYALIPHSGKWDKAHISTEAINWNEPLITKSSYTSKNEKKSLVDVTGTGLQVMAVYVEGKDLVIRVFNAEGDGKVKKIVVGGHATKAELVALNGVVIQRLTMQKGLANTVLMLAMPGFGIRTIRLKNFKAF